MNLAGHFWTIAPHLLRAHRGAGDDAGRPWTTLVRDPARGPVSLSGFLAGRSGARALLVLVHGLGGSAASAYVVDAARAAHDAGLATLRLSLRGADGSGEDVYNAALTDDLRAALASPEVARYECVLALGFSLGGHLVLRYATERTDPRLGGVAAVCAPLDLGACERAIDRPALFLYRRYLLARLRRTVEAAARRRRLPAAMEELRRVRTIREWDRLVVAPRFGFAGPEEYYARSSVGPHLSRLTVPALLVAAERDPMVPAATVRPWLAGAPGLDVRWVVRGGHLGFPTSADLGEAAARGIANQTVAWLARRAGRPPILP